MRRAILVLLTTLAVAAPADAASRLVTYERSGGLAGEMTTLVVRRDRHADLASRTGDRSFTVAAKRYRGLRRALRAADFPNLKDRYASDAVISDGINESVRFRGRTVTVSTGGDPPRRLTRVLGRLRALAQ